MFGHVKGAFTDARQDRTGRFALSDGGTIFLDEIGDLAPSCQVKLLRVLQDRTYEVLGSSKTRSVDVRVISATNRNLLELVESGAFREDLLYRLNLIVLHLPPLRQRPEDIPLLVRHFALGADRVDESQPRLRDRRFFRCPSDAARGRPERIERPARARHHDPRRIGTVDDRPVYGAL